MEGSIRRAHTSTGQQNLREIVRQLNGRLGPTVVSYLAGSRDSRQSLGWAKNDSSEPEQEARERLLTAHRVWTSIATSESDYVVRNWFIGDNPRLGGRTPLGALRDGNLDTVVAASVAFIDGTDG